MHTTIDAIIFDCDGTLVDSEGPGLDVFHQFVLAKGLKFSREEIHQQCRGVPMPDSITWLAGLLGGTSPEFESELTRQVRDRMARRFQEGLNALPGAQQLLGRLTIPFCLASNGPREKIEQTLTLAGLRDFFEERIFSAYEVGSFKPDPGLFLHAAKGLGVAPSRCAVVEDSLPGIQAGLAAGMTVYTLHPPEDTPEELASRISFIKNLADLEQVLLKN